MFNRITSLHLEESFFSIITGNGTKEDFEFILCPKKIFITNHQNYIKKLNFALSNQDKIIKINTRYIKKDLTYIKTLFYEQNQRRANIKRITEITCNYKDLVKNIEDFSLSNELNQGDIELLQTIQGQIIYLQQPNNIEQNKDQIVKHSETYKIKYVFYLLFICLMKNKNLFEKYENNCLPMFKQLFENNKNFYDNISTLAFNIKENLNIDVEFLYKQIPETVQTKDNKRFLFYINVLYFIQKFDINSPQSINEYIQFIKDDDFTNDNNIIAFNFLMDYMNLSFNRENIKPFIQNFFEITRSSQWFNTIEKKINDRPSNIEKNIINSFFATITEKKYPFQNIINESSLIKEKLDKLASISLFFIKLTKDHNQLQEVYQNLQQDVKRILDKSNNSLFQYQFCYFLLNYFNFNVTQNINKLKKIILSETIDYFYNIHFIFLFLHIDVRNRILSYDENTLQLSKLFCIINKDESEMSTSLERINFENDKSFFNKETKNEIFTIIKEDNLLQKEIYIELSNQHLKDIINALSYSPYIIYIQVMVNDIELTTKFLNNIEMITSEHYYILKGIIVSRDIYIYEIYKEQLFHINKKEWVKEIKKNISSPTGIYFVYFKNDLTNEIDIKKRLLCCKGKIMHEKNKQDYETLWESFIWMINNEINFVLKREDFFIEAFNLVEPKTIKKIYDAYHKNQNLKTFCKNIIDKYITNTHKDICQEIQEMKYKFDLCTPDWFVIFIKNNVKQKNEEKLTTDFVSYYYNKVEEISSNDCEAITYMTMLCTATVFPSNKRSPLIKMIISHEDRITAINKLINVVHKLNKNIEVLKVKVNEYWEKCNSDKKQLEQFKCEILFLFTLEQDKININYKKLITKTNILEDQNLIEQFQMLLSYLHETLYKTNYDLYYDLICFSFESSTLFLNEDLSECKSVELELFTLYVENVLQNKKNLNPSNTNIIENNPIEKIMNIIINSGEINEIKVQEAIIKFVYSLRKDNLIINDNIRESIIKYINNEQTKFQELKFMMIFSWNYYEIKQKKTQIKKFVSNLKENFHHKWSSSDIHYIFIFLSEEFENKIKPKEEFIEQMLNNLKSPHKLTSSYKCNENQPNKLFPYLKEENEALHKIFYETRDNGEPILSVVSNIFLTSQKETNELGYIIYYIKNDTENLLISQIIGDKTYQIKGLIFINKERLSDIWLVNIVNKYFYSLSKKKWVISLNDLTQPKYSRIVIVYGMNVNTQTNYISYDKIICDSQPFKIIQDNYLHEILWLIKNDCNNIESCKNLMTIFDLTNNFNKITKMKKYESLSKEEFQKIMIYYHKYSNEITDKHNNNNK